VNALGETRLKHPFSSIRRLSAGALTGWVSAWSRGHATAWRSRPEALEQELRLRNEQFEMLLNAAPIGVYLIDANFRIQHVNPVARQVAGADAGELVGRDYSEVVHLIWSRERAEEVARIFRRTLETGESHHEPEFAEYRADRDLIEYYDWRTQRIVLHDGSYGVVCYFRDISDQVTARKRVAESELRYRTLFESIDVGFCIGEMIFDDAGTAVDFRYLVTNPAFETHTGLVDAKGKTIRALVPDIEDYWIGLCASVAVTGEQKRFVNHVKAIDRWFEVDAFRTGRPEQRRVAMLLSDVSERKRAEQALRESEQRFRTMADSAPALIWVSDTTGKCTYFNRQWLEFTGKPLEAELGDGWMKSVHPDDREQTEEAYDTASAVRGPVRTEFRLRRHDGVYRWLVEEGVPRHLPDGQFAGYVGVCIDITQRMQWERALRETDRRKDEFLSTLSHELRNPLAAVSTATNVLSNSRDDADRVGEMAAIIERQSSQLVRLIDDLLDVSRISRGKVKLERRHIDIADVVRKVLVDCGSVCEQKGLDLVGHLPERPVLVDADPVRMAQVVTNLLDNACKFTPSGGQVRVSVGQECGQAVIDVADNGIGMSREQLPSIFEMFTQVEDTPGDRTGGLGIGLSLAKSIMELHGGTIEAHSEGPEKGSAFALRLRVSDSDAPGDHVTEEIEAEAVRPEFKRIIAADDNVDTLHAVALLLRMKGHDVETAVDGVDALKKVQAHPPDIALLDIGMPGMDGYEVARRIRREPWGQNVLLVATTGWGAQRDKQQAQAAGFDAHLTKPVDLDALERLIAAPQKRTDGPPDVPLH